MNFRKPYQWWYQVVSSKVNMSLNHRDVRYVYLASTSQVDGVFCAVWSVPLSRNILHYLPAEQNKMASSFVYVTEEELFLNKWSRLARQYQKGNEIWQLSIQRYLFLLFF